MQRATRSTASTNELMCSSARTLADRLDEIVASPPGELFAVRRMMILAHLKEASELLRAQAFELERLRKGVP